MDSHTPSIVDASTAEELAQLISRHGLPCDVNHLDWYVGREWSHVRHILDSPLVGMNGTLALEVGCNIGATSITMAELGAQVTAVDIATKYVEIAAVNARRYGVADRIACVLLKEASPFPFENESFDRVCCNSVLEYAANLNQVLTEVDRVLKPGGIVCIVGTSNRWWPWEEHSGKWINYVPKAWSRRVTGGDLLYGVSPRTLRNAFRGYQDLDLQDGSHALMESRRQMGQSPARLKWMKRLNLVAAPLGLSIGMLLHSIQLTLRKPLSR